MPNEKKEEKWTFNFSSIQAKFIFDAMEFVRVCAEKRIENRSFDKFDQFTAKQVSELALEISEQISDVTT